MHIYIYIFKDLPVESSKSDLKSVQIELRNLTSDFIYLYIGLSLTSHCISRIWLLCFTLFSFVLNQLYLWQWWEEKLWFDGVEKTWKEKGFECLRFLNPKRIGIELCRWWKGASQVGGKITFLRTEVTACSSQWSISHYLLKWYGIRVLELLIDDLEILGLEERFWWKDTRIWEVVWERSRK